MSQVYGFYTNISCKSQIIYCTNILNYINLIILNLNYKIYKYVM